MKFTINIFLILIFALLPTACSRASRDSEFHQKILGTWKSTSFPVIFTFNPDGNFLTKWSGTDSASNLTIEGTWKIENGFVVFNVTNTTGPKSKSHPNVGDVERSKIIRIRDNALTYSDEKNVFVAKRQ
jgi:hypothetical protein